jgi:hypothetical protein
MKCRLSTRQKVMVRRGFKFRSKPKFPSPVSDKEMPEFSQSKSAWSKFSKAYVDLLCSGVLVGGTLNQYKKHPPRRKYAKRGEGNSNTLGEQTRDLIAALKQCLNNEPSLEHLWSALQATVAQTVPHRTKKSGPKKKKLKSVGSKPPADTCGTDEKVLWWTDETGHKRAYTINQRGWWTWVPDVPTSASHHHPANRAAGHKGEPNQGRLGTWISGVRSTDWATQPVPKLISFPKIRDSLKLGQKIEGNVVEIWSPDVLDELNTLWSCFGKTEGLTAILFGEARAQNPEATSARLSVTRGSFGPKLEEGSLLRIGPGQGPWLPGSKKVDISTIPTVQRETLRVAAPSFFRVPFIGDRREDSPTLIVQALASLAEAPLHDFLGGRWNAQETKDGKQLVAFLRLKSSTVAKLKPLSGQSGLFFTHINPKDKTEFHPFWIQRNSQENDETYFRRVAALQKERAQPMIFRFGSGANLGFCKKPSDVSPEKVRMHVAQGVPRAWGIGDLESFLQSQAWSEISDLVRKRNSWTFRAKAPKDNATTASWHYDIGSSDSTDWTITIQVAVRAPQAPQKNVSLRGPRREVTLKEFWPAAKVSDPEELPQAKSPTDSQKPAGVSPAATEGVRSSARDRSQRSRSPKRSDEVAPTIPDTQEDESKEDENIGKTEESRPPKKQRLVEPSDPQEALSSFGWQQWDQYGNGDCFFRHVSVFVNKANTQPAVQDSQHHAAWIRAQTCQHIKKHSRRYAELFSGKSAFDAWLTNAAKPTSWADGRTIQAASEKLGCPVVIWNKDGNTYTRYVIAPKFS